LGVELRRRRDRAAQEKLTCCVAMAVQEGSGISRPEDPESGPPRQWAWSCWGGVWVGSCFPNHMRNICISVVFRIRLGRDISRRLPGPALARGRAYFLRQEALDALG